MKKSNLIEVEPEILELQVRPGSECRQMIKIKNVTASTITNMFFCFFNQQLFEFEPDNFNLLPHEEKLITIKLRMQSVDGSKKISNKEFVYLKALNVSIRLAVLLKYQDDEPSSYRNRFSELESSIPMGSRFDMLREEQPRRHSPTTEQDNTERSRTYIDTHVAALQKIISAKEQYINKLQRDLRDKEDREERERIDFSRNMEVSEIELQQTTAKMMAMEAELRQVTKQNRNLQTDLEKSLQAQSSYRSLYEKQKGLYTELKLQFQRLLTEKQICQQKMEELEQRLLKRDDRIKQLQSTISRMKDQMRSDNQKRVESLQSKLTEQRNLYETEFNSYDQRLKELEFIAQNSEALRNQSARFEQQLIRRTEELKHAKSQIQTLRKSIKQLESQKMHKVRLELENSRLHEDHQSLFQKAQKYEAELQKHRQQLYMYRSRVEDPQDSAKSYLDVALDSCKSQIDILRRDKARLDKAIGLHLNNQKMYRQKIQFLQNQLSKRSLRPDQNRQIDIERTEQFVRLKEENVLLLQRLQQLAGSSFEKAYTTGNRAEQLQLQLGQKNAKLQELEELLRLKSNELDSVQEQLAEEEKKRKQAEKQKNKYKNELKEDLNNINQAAMEEIRKLTADKKKLTKKLAQARQLTEEDRQPKSKNDDRDRTVSQKPTTTPSVYTKKLKNSQQGSPPSNKLQQIQSQLYLMREELNVVKEQQFQSSQPSNLGHSRKIGIHNQKREVYDSRHKSQSQISPVNWEQRPSQQDLYKQLSQLREMYKAFDNEQSRLRSQFGIPYDQYYQGRGVFKIIAFFKTIEDVLRQQQTKQKVMEQVHEDQLRDMSLKIREKENDSRFMNNASVSYDQKPAKLYEYLQQQMRNQYKKLNDTIQFSHEKYELLKKKLQGEYRSRISDLLGKKDKTQLPRFEHLLQKFIEGLSNTSHKEAMLAKQVKKKLEYKRDNELLKKKVEQFQLLLFQKKGICTRDPVKIHLGKRPQDYIHEAVKAEAQLLTCQAENKRLTEELNLTNQNSKEATAELKNYVQLLQEKQDEIVKLKAEVLQIDRMHKQEMSNLVSEMDSMRNQYIKVSQLEQQLESMNGKDRQCIQLRRELNRKRELIDGMRQKQRNLIETVEKLQKEGDEDRPKAYKEKYEEVAKLQEIINELRDKSKDLKNELQNRDENQKRLHQEIQRKNAYIQSLKAATGRSNESASQQHQLEVVRLSTQLKQVQQRLAECKSSNSKLNSNIQNLKNRVNQLQKQLVSVQNELKSSNSQWLIKQKSLNSIIRSMIEMLRRLWRLLQIKAKKLNPSLQPLNFESLVKEPSRIDMIALYDNFEDLVRQFSRQ